MFLLSSSWNSAKRVRERMTKPTRKDTVATREEVQPTLGPWTGFEPVRLETPRTPKRSWFHCTTVALSRVGFL
ncbi:hypothetical protein E2C01_096881 [Portunus trituberculatus]|uniref:Uncharacterized protein n=1 Tax=Portunus trituberculatus TaxID=210409 RepID=A0A5B7K812_PORTR|nr:hypothetical protein [Portunus trituberculatus]